MKLYIGGYCQGKLAYVLREPEHNTGILAEGEKISVEEPGKVDLLNHFHLLIKRLLAKDMDVTKYVEELLAANPDITIICDEVGMGIVPADPKERQYRETVGRCCCLLAQKASEVERIVCGRGMRIK